MNTLPIGLLHLLYFDENTARGALLVIDQDTSPLEFLVTEEVQPTNIQTLLYGPVLKKTLAVKVIGLPLLQQAQNKMVLILVKDKTLLDIRPHIETPMACISGSEESIQVEEAGREIVPVSLSIHPRYPKDLQVAERVLLRIQKVTTPHEPFERLEIALRAAQRSNLKQEGAQGA